MDINTQRLLLASAAGGADPVPYIDDHFNATAYRGYSSLTDPDIPVSGIDLAGEGGAVFIVDRDLLTPEMRVYNTILGGNKYQDLHSNAENGPTTDSDGVVFLNNGFRAENSVIRNSTKNYASFTLRNHPKLFNVVSYTGDGQYFRAVDHGLDSAPGMVWVRGVGQFAEWGIWHQTESYGYYFSSTSYSSSRSIRAYNPTNSLFYFKNNSYDVGNKNGQQYIAYFFASDPTGAFGPNEDRIISKAGSYTASGSTTQVSLGFEPQFIITKRYKLGTSSKSGSWYFWDLEDNTRHQVGGNTYTSATYSDYSLRATYDGFVATGNTSVSQANYEYLYWAVAKGGDRPASSAEEVFASLTGNINPGNSQTLHNIGFNPHMIITGLSDSNNGGSSIPNEDFPLVLDRLNGIRHKESSFTTGNSKRNSFSVSEIDQADNTTRSLWTGIAHPFVGTGSQQYDSTQTLYQQSFFFRKAGKFFDQTMYRGGSGSSLAIPHNLGTKPELVMHKRISGSNVNTYSDLDWHIELPVLFDNSWYSFNTTAPNYQTNLSYTDSHVNVGSSSSDKFNMAGDHKLFMWASCPGVSKVGKYTVTTSPGSGGPVALYIDCGFTAGARFIFIFAKTGSSGIKKYIFSTDKGITSGHDGHEVWGEGEGYLSGDGIDHKVFPYAQGFGIGTPSSYINTYPNTYFFLAIA